MYHRDLQNSNYEQTERIVFWIVIVEIFVINK